MRRTLIKVLIGGRGTAWTLCPSTLTIRTNNDLQVISAHCHETFPNLYVRLRIDDGNTHTIIICMVALAVSQVVLSDQTQTLD